jgi:DNA-3-methyladenine glycosylase I
MFLPFRLVTIMTLTKLRTSPRRAASYNAKHSLTKSIEMKRPITKETRTTKENSSSSWYTAFTKTDPIYDAYMETEWGYEKRDDTLLFEKLCLEGAQSGLSWRTILNKREAYRKFFHGFDIDRVTQMTSSEVDDILNSSVRGNDMVVRHRGKIESVIHNAKQLQTMPERVDGYTNLSDYLWRFVDDKPILNAWKMLSETPSKTDESEAMSKALKKLGFKFVGPTTCYSLMQSCGFVIDHPFGTKEWEEALERLQTREGGFQDRR